MKRREFLVAGAGALVVAGLPVISRRQVAVKRTLPIMGTIAELTVVDRDQSRAQDAIDQAYAVLKDVERRMTRFRADSEIGRANAAAHLAPVAVSAATYTVVNAALRWARVSNGAFEPGIGRVVELWDVEHRHEPPPNELVQRLAGRHFFHLIEAGHEAGEPRVFFRDDGVHLDLGAIAKGYGIDVAMERLRQLGIRRALIDVGGEVVAMGGNAEGEPWRVGIASPDNPREIRRTVELSDGAIATSGDYEQFFRWRGRRYHHLMDPETAAPRVTPRHSVTVMSETCMDADAAATAVFGMESSEAQRLLDTNATRVRVLDVI